MLYKQQFLNTAFFCIHSKYPPALVVVVTGDSILEEQWEQDLATGFCELAVISYAEPGTLNCSICSYV